MSEAAALIFVDVVEDVPDTFETWCQVNGSALTEEARAEYQHYLHRFQPWRWTAKSGDNQEPMAVSSERYFNEADCKHAIDLLFSGRSNVYLRQKEHGNVELRLAS